MMGVGTLGAIATELIRHGLDPQTRRPPSPTAACPASTWSAAPWLRSPTATAAAGIRPPAVTVIGSVAAFDPTEPSRGSWE